MIKSDKTSVKANLVYTGQSSQLSVGLGSKPITDFRGGTAKSRLSGCGVSPTSAYSTETAAKAAVKACFSEAIYNQIEADMAYLMKNQNAQTAIYTFTQPVTMQFKVRNAAGATTAIWPQINNSAYDGHSIDILGTKYLFGMEMISYPEDIGNKANAFGMITLKPQTAAASSITFSVNINNKGWERITFTKSGAGYKDIDIIGDKYDMLSTVNGKYGAEFDFSDRTREVLIKDIVVK